MSDNIKAKSVNGVIWTFIENMSLSMITFVIGVIMARLLMPSDYGVLAIILVFISILQLFVDGGFAMALVQDKTKGPRDYSTVFTFNVLVSVVCYLLLFFAAPLISKFYNTDITVYIRVVGLNLIIGAFSAIHKIIYVAEVNFKPTAIVNATSSMISGIVGISMAYIGYGIWALVAQNLTSVTMSTLILIIINKWRPVCFFDKASFKKLFPIGSRMLMSNIIDRIYTNLYPLLVGKFYTTQELGYFSRADGLVTFPASTASSVLYRVTYPVLSSINDEQQLVSVYRRYIQISSLLLFPMLLLMAIVAKPLILILLTEKWSSIIVLFQILCLSWLFNHLSAINLNLVYVKGRADLALKLEVIKKTTAVGIVLVSVQFGLIGLCIGKVIFGVFAFFMNSIYTKSLISVSLLDQFKDFLPSLLVSFISAIISYAPVILIHNSWVQIITGISCYVAMYVILCFLFKVQAFKYALSNVMPYLNKLRYK
jgi:O-antigen/teichoic acid export membrane protein